MNGAVPPATASARLPRFLGGRVAVPSWLGSLVLHCAVLLLLLTFWKPPVPRGDFPGEGGDSFREVGIRMSSDGGAPESLKTATPVPDAVPTPNPVASVPETIPLPSTVSLALPVLPTPPAVIGTGTLPTLSSPQVEQFIKSAPIAEGLGGVGTGRGSGTGEGGTGVGGKGTSFLGIGAAGKRFVYVIDRSSSMAVDHALQAAKLELLSSLQRLDETQQFQIIFYNQNVYTLDTRGGRFDVFRGTDAHRLRVTEQIRDITPSEGTNHLPAILEGLKFNPDVLFLLTDGAAESALDRKDLETIQRHNRGGTFIHCIEFGRGTKSPLVDSANFLMELARQNQGRYLFRDTRTILTSRDNP